MVPGSRDVRSPAIPEFVPDCDRMLLPPLRFDFLCYKPGFLFSLAFDFIRCHTPFRVQNCARLRSGFYSFPQIKTGVRQTYVI